MFCINNTIGSGGMEKVLSQRVNYFVKYCNYDITLVTTENTSSEYRGKSSFYYFDSRVNIIDLGINYIDFFKESIKYSYLKKKYLAIKKKKQHLSKLDKVVNEIKPDILVSFGDADRHIMYKLTYKCKMILEHHFMRDMFIGKKLFDGKNNDTSALKKIKIMLNSYRERKLIDKFDYFLVLTDEDKKLWGDMRIKVIPNPLTFYPSKSTECEKKKVISVGRLEKQKGFDLLIDIWKNVSLHHSDWILEIYGSGSEKNALLKKVADLKLEKSIFFKGVTKNIKNKYLESSIYIFTSRFEGFGMVITEAMACGLPVVAFDSPCGPKDIISDGEDGYVVEFGNIDEMSKRVHELIIDDEKRKNMGRKAKENVKRYSEELIMKKWKTIYETLVRE